LHSQIEGVYEWLSFEERIDEQVQKFKSLNFSSQGDIYLNDFFRRRSEELKNVLEELSKEIPVTLNEWEHVTGTVETMGTTTNMSIYVNGEYIGSNTVENFVSDYDSFRTSKLGHTDHL